MIELKNIVKKYKSQTVLEIENLRFNEDEFVAIVGASGSGKSTLLNLIGGLDKPTSGEVLFDGENISKFNDRKLSKFRGQKIGFIFQFHHLLPEFTALENVCIPGWLGKKSKREVQQRAKMLLEKLHVGHRMENKPNELSGGEQQRVAVARALINQPDIIFADEPTGNLDTHNANELHQLFLDLRDEFQQTFLIVTHNNELENVSDRVLKMKDGLIVS